MSADPDSCLTFTESVSLRILNRYINEMNGKINVKVNGFKAWLLASRPVTLTGAASPVLMGMSLFFSDFIKVGGADSSVARFTFADNILPFMLCLFFAFIMQIDANFINDYYDFIKGTDREDRLGPKRACAQGWVTPGAMRIAIAITTVIGCAVGLPLVLYGGWQMVAVGLLCVVFCFLYTTRLSYLGYGDVLVLVFFGIVPVCLTYYIQSHSLPPIHVFLASVACGLVTDCLLMVNNYRDRHQDALSSKRTVVVRFGEKFGKYSYLWLGIVAVLLIIVVGVINGEVPSVTASIYLFLHLKTYRQLVNTDGKALNAVLGLTARNIFVFGFLFSAETVVESIIKSTL